MPVISVRPRGFATALGPLTLVATLAVAAVLVALVLWCTHRLSTPPLPAVAEPTVSVGALALSLASWRSYAPAPLTDDWAQSPLDDASYVQVSAELACAGRANHGDPEAHHQAARRILFHHGTRAEMVMNYSIAVNQDGPRAVRLGAQVAEATDGCR